MPVAKPPTRTGPCRFGVGIEVETRAVDGGEDGDCVVGQPLPGRGQPDPPALGLDQLGAGLLCERGDLLRHRRRGQVMGLGDRTHRAEPR